MLGSQPLYQGTHEPIHGDREPLWKQAESLQFKQHPKSDNTAFYKKFKTKLVWSLKTQVWLWWKVRCEVVTLVIFWWCFGRAGLTFSIKGFSFVVSSFLKDVMLRL